MDYKKLILLLLIIALGLFLKEKYDERKAGQKVEPPVVKGTSSFIKEKIKESENTLQEVLGTSTQFVADQASKSANIVTSLILEKSSEKIVEQIEKLPDNTKKEVKESICK